MRLTRRERIRLLLSTYLDAMSPGRNPTDMRGAFGSKPPARTQLQDEGSYYELGQALDALRGPCPKIYRHTVGFYVTHPPESWAQKRTAEKGVMLLERAMPRNLFVPMEVSERGGFSPGEAKSATKPRRLAA